MGAPKRLAPAKYFQSLLEWRFPRAHRYWDDPGKLTAAIEATFPGLKCDGLDGEGFKFSGASSGVNGARFYWEKALIQTGSDVGALASAAATFWGLVEGVLSPEKPSFVGHRTWICFETPTIQEAVRWLDNTSIWRFSNESLELGSPWSAGTVLRTRLEDKRRLRVFVDAGTISNEGRNELKGVIVDADITVLDQTAIPNDMAEFVNRNAKFLRESVVPLLRSK